MSLNVITRLTHILEETKFLVECSNEFNTIEELENNKYLSRSSTRSIEIIGEAVKSLPPQLKLQYPEIPWSKIAKMRDKLIHHYFEVDYKIVWEVVKSIVPELNTQIEQILATCYRSHYIELQQQTLQLEQISQLDAKIPSSYLTKLNYHEKQDIIVAKAILNSYPKHKQDLAIEEIKNTIAQGDYLESIANNEKNKNSKAAYLDNVVAIVTNDKPKIDRDNQR